MRTSVYLTVDTEHSMGGAWGNAALRPVPTERHIFCRIKEKDHGIGWICDELDRHGLKATFFAEMFCSLVFGKEDTRGWCQYLIGRGQDVQLHTHLNFYFYALQRGAGAEMPHRTDDLADIPQPARLALLEQACELYFHATGRNPLAFRAGNWRGSRSLVEDLPRVGIHLDSSFNPAVRTVGSFRGDGLKRNVLQKLGEDLWELPLTVTRQTLPEPSLVNQLRPLDLVSLSSAEMIDVLEQAHAAGMQHVMLVMHCFSGVKKKDVQYHTMKPDRIVRRRLRALLDHVGKSPEKFRMRTVGDLASELSDDAGSEKDFLPTIGLVQPALRKIVQAMNCLYWV